MQAAAGFLLRRQVVGQVAGEFTRVQAGLPDATLLRQSGNQLVQLAPLPLQVFAAQSNAAGQVLAQCGVVQVAAARLQQLLPGIDVQRVQAHVGRHALAGQGLAHYLLRALFLSPGDGAAQHLRQRAVRAALVLHLAQAFELQEGEFMCGAGLCR